MIIYKDVISDDELMSDSYKYNEAANGFLWEIDIKKYPKKNQDFELEGANPSAEGGDDMGGEDAGTGEMVHDIEESFQLNWLKDEMRPSKAFFKSHLKKYLRGVNDYLKEEVKAGRKTKAELEEFQNGAPDVVKKIMGNFDNYDIMMGASMNGDAMHVLIDFREDGVTPFATVWKHGLKEMKV